MSESVLWAIRDSMPHGLPRPSKRRHRILLMSWNRPPQSAKSKSTNSTAPILEGPNIPENVIVKGAGSVGTSGAIGAVDRITHEILLSLDERPTLVVWLFDQSGSLKPQRESIAKRFDESTRSWASSKLRGNEAFSSIDEKPLLTAVAEFGTAVELLTPKPTDDLTEIKAAVRAVSDDTDSGQENVFQSVGFLGREVPASSAGQTTAKRDDRRVHR